MVAMRSQHYITNHAIIKKKTFLDKKLELRMRRGGK